MSCVFSNPTYIVLKEYFLFAGRAEQDADDPEGFTRKECNIRQGYHIYYTVQ